MQLLSKTRPSKTRAVSRRLSKTLMPLTRLSVRKKDRQRYKTRNLRRILWKYQGVELDSSEAPLTDKLDTSQNSNNSWWQATQTTRVLAYTKQTVKDCSRLTSPTVLDQTLLTTRFSISKTILKWSPPPWKPIICPINKIKVDIRMERKKLETTIMLRNSHILRKM